MRGRDWRTHSRIFQLRATRFAIRPPAKSNSIAAIRSPPPSFVLFGNIIERLQKSGTHARPDRHFPPRLRLPPVHPSLPRVPFSSQPFHLELKRRDSSLSFPFLSLSCFSLTFYLTFIHCLLLDHCTELWKRLDALHLRRHLVSIFRSPLPPPAFFTNGHKVILRSFFRDVQTKSARGSCSRLCSASDLGLSSGKFYSYTTIFG